MNIDFVTIGIFLGITGIGLEIWGFFWLLKYREYINFSKYESWRKNHNYNEISDFDSDESQYITVYVEMGERGRRSHVMQKIYREYYNLHNGRRQGAIILIIIGLIAQGLQIIS